MQPDAPFGVDGGVEDLVEGVGQQLGHQRVRPAEDQPEEAPLAAG